MTTCYARWLVWAAASHPDALEEGPGNRATKDRVIDYSHALHNEVTFRTIHGYACRLKRALELMAPDRDWSWFTPLIKNIESHVRDEPSVKRPFVPADKLLVFGSDLMERVDKETHLPAQKRAETFRNGLIIAFLACRPLRLKNMIELEIGTQFIETPTGFEVNLPQEKIKTHRQIEFPMPDALAPYLRRYLAEFRPALAAGTDGKNLETQVEKFMWLARSGARFAVATCEDMVSRLTSERFGVRLTPQDFRHCVATSIAEFHPQELHIIRIILGHATTDTADRHYIHAKGIEAARKAQAVVIGRRKALAKRNRNASNTTSRSSG